MEEHLETAWADALASAKMNGRPARRPETNIGTDLMYAVNGLREQMVTLADLGEIELSVDVWARQRLTHIRYPNSNLDIEQIASLVRRLPPKQPVSDLTGIIMLKADAPQYTLEMNDPKAMMKSNGGFSTYYNFTIVAPLTLKLANLTFALDVEQMALRHGGQFQCWVLSNTLSTRKAWQA